MLRAAKKVQALEEAGQRVESLQQLKELASLAGKEDSLDRLAAFATTHGLTASIAALSEEGQLAAFGDMLRASKKVQALEEAGKRVESLQQLKELASLAGKGASLAGKGDRLDRLAAFATTHGLTTSIAALSEEAKLAAFGNMLAASKQLKELEARGERVRDLQHLGDIARPAQSAAGQAGGQAGSHRQVNAHTPEWLWTQYKGHVGEGPVAASGSGGLLFSLPQLSANDQDGVFGGLVRTMLNVTISDWDPTRFGKSNGVDKIREKIRDETLKQYGAHIGSNDSGATQKRLDRIRKIQENWDKQAGTHTTQWEPTRPHNHSQLTRRQRDKARRRMISDKYFSMEREVQVSVVKTLSDNDRTRLAAHLALGWYRDKIVQSGAA